MVREWIFLGGHEVHYKNLSLEPVIKSHNTIGRQMMPDVPVPQELRAIRQQLNIDYGKMDYVLHDGQPALFDINKTMGAPKSAITHPELLQAINYISQGISAFAPGGVV